MGVLNDGIVERTRIRDRCTNSRSFWVKLLGANYVEAAQVQSHNFKASSTDLYHTHASLTYSLCIGIMKSFELRGLLGCSSTIIYSILINLSSVTVERYF